MRIEETTARTATLSDNRRLWAYFNVSEAEHLSLKSATPDLSKIPVQLRMAKGVIFEQPGMIETVDAEFDSETGTIAFRAGFANPSDLVRHGETSKILVAEAVPDALVIPQKATFEVLDRTFSYVVDDHGVVHTRPIKIRAKIPQLFVIESGLSESDRVLVEWLGKVRDGAEIVVDYRPPADVLSHLDVAAE